MGGQIAVYLVMAVLVLLALFAMMATRYRSSVMFMSSSAWFAVVTVL